MYKIIIKSSKFVLIFVSKYNRIFFIKRGSKDNKSIRPAITWEINVIHPHKLFITISVY